MQYLTLFLKLFPFIIQLMSIAEKFGESGSGIQKKEMVVGGVKTVIDGIAAVSTGGQKETWDKIKDPVSGLVDSIARLLF